MSKEQLCQSLSSTDDQILPYLPFLLQDLWSLGGQPDIQIEMIKSLQLDSVKLLDLGCGKGSSLIQILKVQRGCGLGVDLMESFIGVARKKAQQWGVADRGGFQVQDLVQTLDSERGYDMVLYGRDSDVLGSTEHCFRRLGRVLRPHGYVLVDTVYTGKDAAAILQSRQSFIHDMGRAGFSLLREAVWDKQSLKQMNQAIIHKIKQRAMELSVKLPPQKEQFFRYVTEQQQESFELEEEMSCVTLLCQLS